MYHAIFQTVTDVFWWNLEAPRFYVVNQGGTSSSKTVSIMQVICDKLMRNKLKCLVTASHHHVLNSGAKTDLQDIISVSPILRGALVNPDAEGDKFIFKNGSRIIFKAFDKPEKAKPGKRDILFINEANHVPYIIAETLMSRTKRQVFIDFNADARFWAHTEIVEGDPLRCNYFISNFTNNEYLPPETYRNLQKLLYKAEKKGTQFWRNHWDVYGLGAVGSIAGTIFGHNYNQIPNFDLVMGLKKRCYSIDYGYTNDPTAVVECGVKFGNFYGKLLMYETGQYGPELANKLKYELDLDPRIPIIADTDHSSNMSLRRAGFKVKDAVKWPYCVKQGINFMQGLDLYIDKNSHEWHEEAKNYKFKLNKVTNEYSNEPIDAHNHAFDAARNYLMLAFRQTPQTKGVKKPRKRRVGIR